MQGDSCGFRHRKGKNDGRRLELCTGCGLETGIDGFKMQNGVEEKESEWWEIISEEAEFDAGKLCSPSLT